MNVSKYVIEVVMVCVEGKMKSLDVNVVVEIIFCMY